MLRLRNNFWNFRSFYKDLKSQVLCNFFSNCYQRQNIYHFQNILLPMVHIQHLFWLLSVFSSVNYRNSAFIPLGGFFSYHKLRGQWITHAMLAATYHYFFCFWIKYSDIVFKYFFASSGED